MSKLTAITAIPKIKPIIVTLLFSYSLAIGSSSSTDINTIIPAMNPNSSPNTISLKNGLNSKYPITAPIGSASPDKNDILNAFFLSPVAK